MVTEKENKQFLEFLENKEFNSLELELINFLKDGDSLQICKDISNHGLEGGTWIIYDYEVIEIIKRNFELFFITLEEINYELKLNIKFDDFFKMYCIVYEYINSKLLNEYEGEYSIE